MADQQQITIDYSVAARGKLPAVDVNLVLTYDTTQSAEDKRLGAYQVTGATGTYTTTTANKDGTTTVKSYEIFDTRKRGHLGSNDNKIYPNGTRSGAARSIVDRFGVTFVFKAPRPHDQSYVRTVNLFNNPYAAKGTAVQQYTDHMSRNVVTLTTSDASAASASTAHVSVLAADPLCFAAGTLIRTACGDVAVEALEVGDLAVTASGALRPIKWLGRREIDLRTHRRPGEAAPVRIAAQAFGPGLPARDLFLSPGHPVLVGADADHEGGHLVPIMCLINGTTIARVPMPSVTYWHVELDGHDILLAEGLPAESFIACGDRTFFTGEDDGALANPDLVMPGLAGRCRPVAIDGAVVEVERDRLDCVFATRLAQACAWPEAAAAQDF